MCKRFGKWRLDKHLVEEGYQSSLFGCDIISVIVDNLLFIITILVEFLCLEEASFDAVSFKFRPKESAQFLQHDLRFRDSL